MLEELRIRDLGVIADAVLPLGPGLTVVTGETGAGKTMVVTGLLLLFGGRADADRVRSGATQASVDGVLTVDAGTPVADRVREAGGDLDDDTTLVLRRVISAAGRSRAHVGGAATPVSVLGELAERLVAVHGQSDQLRLARPAQQRDTLDRYAGLERDGTLGDYATAFATWRGLDERLTDLAERRGSLLREAEMLEHGLAEIEAAAPQPGEDRELQALVARLGHADGLTTAAGAAHDALAGDPADAATDGRDVSTLLGFAHRELDLQAGNDAELDLLATRLGELAALVSDLALDLAAYRDRIDADPRRLEAAQQRLAVLTALVRKYADGPGVAAGSDATRGIDAVLAWAQSARERHADLDVSDERVAELTAQRDAAATTAATAAARLSEARSAAAEQLAAAVTAELAGLAMPTAEVVVRVAPRPPTAGAVVLEIDGAPRAAGPDGTDDVELLFRARPDAPLLPIGRGASGGELSRVMLAVEVCLIDRAGDHGADRGAERGGDRDAPTVPTLVFDEVDAGVGGRAAVEVGRRLARLAARHQVIVVTHLAQVAAFADRHVVVDRPTGGVSTSDVHVVDGDARAGELARMLGGTDSETAREHAAELLTSAAADARRDRRTGRKARRPRRDTAST